MLGLNGEFEVEIPPGFLSSPIPEMLPNDWYEGSEDRNANDTGTMSSARKCNRNRNMCNVICANNDLHKVTPCNRSGRVCTSSEPRHTNDLEDNHHKDTSCESQRTDGSDTITSQSNSHIDHTSLRKVLGTDISNNPCRENGNKYVQEIQGNLVENLLINPEVGGREQLETEDIVLTIGPNKVKAIGKTLQWKKRRKKDYSKSMEIQDSNSKVTSLRKSTQVEFSDSTDKQKMQTRGNTTTVKMDGHENNSKDGQS